MDEERAIRSTYEDYESSHRSESWSTANQGYARLAADRNRALLATVGRCLEAVPEGRVLDVGCGAGELLGTIADRWPSVSVAGIDLLEERIAAAGERVPRADLRVGSARTLPFPDASFDVVLAIVLFSSLPSRDLELAVAGEIRRVLRRPGWLVWYDLRRPNPRNRAVHAIGAPDLEAMFPGWSQELRSFTVLPPLARRLGRTTPVAYPLLDRLPVTRSHLLGRLRAG